MRDFEFIKVYLYISVRFGLVCFFFLLDFSNKNQINKKKDYWFSSNSNHPKANPIHWIDLVWFGFDFLNFWLFVLPLLKHNTTITISTFYKFEGLILRLINFKT